MIYKKNKLGAKIEISFKIIGFFQVYYSYFDSTRKYSKLVISVHLVDIDYFYERLQIIGKLYP